MKIFFKGLAVAIGLPVSVFVVYLILTLIIDEVDRNTCAREVNVETAKAFVENELRQPRNSAVLRGKYPVIEEIEEINHETTDPERVQKRFKFRLRGTQSSDWGFLTLDDCGGTDMTGGFAGRD